MIETLFTYLEVGTDVEKAGAVNALYWAEPPQVIEGPADEIAETHAKHLELADLWDRKRSLFVREFVHNENLQVRRSERITFSANSSKFLYTTERVLNFPSSRPFPHFR